MQKWMPPSDPLLMRRLGKTAEELAELLAVIARITIQGVDEIDLNSGKTNRQRLSEEFGDVRCQLARLEEILKLDGEEIFNRWVSKNFQMNQWESYYTGEENA